MNVSQIEQMQLKLRDIPDGMLYTEYNLQNEACKKMLREPSCLKKNEKGYQRIYTLYPGVKVSFLDCLAEKSVCRHDADENILEIHYCRAGRSGWSMQDGTVIYLGAKDFSVQTRALCSGSVMHYPNGYYSGLVICIDIVTFAYSMPELLAEAGVTGEMIREKFCGIGGFTVFTGSETTEAVFCKFYDVPESLYLPYFKLKVQELLLDLCRRDVPVREHFFPYRPEQIATIKAIHERLTKKLDQRITIEELAKQFLINPSTMKAVFKAVYGNSIAAHIKEHRMEKAASLLQSTSETIASVAKQVGYESQSKFSAEFKKVYQMSPAEYRKRH